MLDRNALAAALGATLAAGALAFAPAAHADRLNFSLSLAGPGYGVTVGNGPWHTPSYRPYYRGHVRTYAPPRVVYRAPVVVAPPAYYPAPTYYPAPAYYPAPTYYAPAYYGSGRYSGRIYYRY